MILALSATGFLTNIFSKISRILTKNEDSAGSPREDDYEGDNESRTPFVKSRQELFQWVDGVLPEPDDEIQQTPEIIDTEGLQLPHSADVERSIHQSDAYRWLLSKISQHVTLSYGAPNVMAEIRTSVSNQLQLQNSVRSMSRHRPSSLVEVTFHLEWNPKRYIQGLGFRSSPSSTLDNVYSLTGTWCEAQVLSVSDYIHQTWPVTGYPMKYVLQELIAIPEGEQCTCTYNRTD